MIGWSTPRTSRRSRGAKTDVKDAEWIAQLLEHRLLCPLFLPPPDIRRLRMLTRHRVQLMGDRTREITRLELMPEDASIRLSSVAAQPDQCLGTGDARMCRGVEAALRHGADTVAHDHHA